MVKTGSLGDDKTGVVEGGDSRVMEALGENLGPCACCSRIPKPHYKAGTPQARRAASNAESFMLETEEHGTLFIDRAGLAFKLDEDGMARERVGRVSQFIEVPIKSRKIKAKKSKK